MVDLAFSRQLSAVSQIFMTRHYCEGAMLRNETEARAKPNVQT
jgi:hypothetical protein